MTLRLHAMHMHLRSPPIHVHGLSCAVARASVSVFMEHFWIGNLELEGKRKQNPPGGGGPFINSTRSPARSPRQVPLLRKDILIVSPKPKPKPLQITHEIIRADKRTFCQFSDLERPWVHITRPWGIHSPPKTTTAALVP